MAERRIPEGAARCARGRADHGGKDKGEGVALHEEAAPFFVRVYEIVRAIPRGHVVSYGQIAYMLGAPRAARQVGWAMRRCPDDLPWQRVVMSDGTIAGGGYAELRRTKLEAEGVKFTRDGKVDMRACLWNGRAQTGENSAE